MSDFGEKLKANWKLYCNWKDGPRRVISKWDMAFNTILVVLFLVMVVVIGLLTGEI
jgi:hypothetical protein